MKCSYFFLVICLSILGFSRNLHSAVARCGEGMQVLHYVKPYLPKNPVIIEAGSFNGENSLRMAQFWPRGEIHVFEPVPEHCQLIEKLFDEERNLRLHQKALSDFTGRATLYLSVLENDPDHISASSSLLVPKEHLLYAPNIYYPQTMEVETISLDEWARQARIGRVDFLWLDMQGYELNMLKASHLARNARAIWMEVEFVEAFENQYLFKDVYEWMTANGFTLLAADFDMNNPGWKGNALFVKK
jgi:FkbM family methyltransferase